MKIHWSEITLILMIIITNMHKQIWNLWTCRVIHLASSLFVFVLFQEIQNLDSLLITRPSSLKKKKMAEKIANSSLYLHNLILVSVVFFISEVRNVHFRITLNYFHFLEMKLPIFQISRRPCFIIFTLSNDRSRWVHSQLISPKFLHWNTHPKKNSF